MMNRRDLCFLMAAAPALVPPTEDKPLRSQVFAFDELPVQKDGANEFRHALAGITNGGDHIEVHETQLAPGGQHTPHRHVHEEMFLIRRGTVRITVNERTTQIGAGGVAFIRSGELHGILNSGMEPAEYFVVAFATDRG